MKTEDQQVFLIKTLRKIVDDVNASELRGRLELRESAIRARSMAMGALDYVENVKVMEDKQ